MEDLDHLGSQPGSGLRAAAGNESWTGSGGVEVPAGRTQVLLEILMVLMCLGAVTGNILVIVIVVATKTFHCVTSVLIMNLAVSDLLVGVGVMPFVALSIMNRDWVDFSNLCLYVGYTSSVYCTASVLTLAAIALDRYLSIIDCLRYSSRCTLWRTVAVVMWIWTQALASSCPPLLGWSSVTYVVPMYSCAVDWTSNPGYAALMAALSYLLPAVVIVFCYVSIVKVARGHARRIHALEDSVQRSTGAFNPDQQQQRRRSGSLPGLSTFVYHVSGQFVADAMGPERDHIRPYGSDPASEQNQPAPRLGQGSQQNLNHHHGVARLFLVISAFFFCWTPYVGVALVQATETAISGRSSLVPPFAVTFSYWLVLLNSDINPLLYALLCKRFQGALQGLGQKVRAHLGRSVEVRAEEGDCKSSDPSVLNTTHSSPPSSSESSACDLAKAPPNVLTVSSDLSQESLCKVCGTGNTLSSSDSDGRVDRLQVPARPHEGTRLPFSALTTEPQATFLYGQIIVIVEHDV